MIMTRLDEGYLTVSHTVSSSLGCNTRHPPPEGNKCMNYELLSSRVSNPFTVIQWNSPPLYSPLLTLVDGLHQRWWVLNRLQLPYKIYVNYTVLQ